MSALDSATVAAVPGTAAAAPGANGLFDGLPPAGPDSVSTYLVTDHDWQRFGFTRTPTLVEATSRSIPQYFDLEVTYTGPSLRFDPHTVSPTDYALDRKLPGHQLVGDTGLAELTFIAPDAQPEPLKALQLDLLR